VATDDRFSGHVVWIPTGEARGTLPFGLFRVPNLIGLGLAIVSEALWLLLYRPPLFQKGGLWIVLISSALITLVAVTFLQIPLQVGVGRLIGENVLAAMLLVAGIPAILLSGLVQEGAKLVPVVVAWLNSGRKMDAHTGLLIGAVAGAGFGIFEALWAHNMIFAGGWS
jgi:RsiW-degrading membrane proteinase PrsW (M82 family)